MRGEADLPTVNVTICGKQFGISTANKAAAGSVIDALEAAYVAGNGGG